jgi:hypothetical protein
MECEVVDWLNEAVRCLRDDVVDVDVEFDEKSTQMQNRIEVDPVK